MGTGSMDYGLNHFFIFKNIGYLIQNPLGIGTVPMAMCVVGLGYSLYTIFSNNLFTKKHSEMAILLVWTIFIKRTGRSRAGADFLLVKIQTVIAERLDRVPWSGLSGINTL